ncbi:MAG: hypothetical protein JWO06_2385 [Bacteroidota bacterium]|nr:hypothetical protein [Bacteroidota bacterium]
MAVWFEIKINTVNTVESARKPERIEFVCFQNKC